MEEGNRVNSAKEGSYALRMLPADGNRPGLDEDALAARISATVMRRPVSRNERKRQLEELATLMQKRGVPRGKIVDEIAEKTGLSEGYVRILLPRRFKMTSRVKAAEEKWRRQKEIGRKRRSKSTFRCRCLREYRIDWNEKRIEEITTRRAGIQRLNLGVPASRVALRISRFPGRIRMAAEKILSAVLSSLKALSSSHGR